MPDTRERPGSDARCRTGLLYWVRLEAQTVEKAALQPRRRQPLASAFRVAMLAAAIVTLSAALAQSTGDISLYGGPNNRQYLGCWSCSSTNSDSIFNDHGSYGSRYGSNSIWNQYSQYGSTYASYSVCNPYTSSAPILVDGRGGFYGHLTVNRYHSQRVDDEDILRWLETAVCGRR